MLKISTCNYPISSDFLRVKRLFFWNFSGYGIWSFWGLQTPFVMVAIPAAILILSFIVFVNSLRLLAICTNIDTFGSFKHFLHKIRKAKIAFIFFFATWTSSANSCWLRRHVWYLAVKPLHRSEVINSALPSAYRNMPVFGFSSKFQEKILIEESEPILCLRTQRQSRKNVCSKFLFFFSLSTYNTETCLIFQLHCANISPNCITYTTDVNIIRHTFFLQGEGKAGKNEKKIF